MPESVYCELYSACMGWAAAAKQEAAAWVLVGKPLVGRLICSLKAPAWLLFVLAQ